MKDSSEPQVAVGITPYLLVRNAKEAIEFYERAFDANVILVLESPDKMVAHAEVRIEGSTIMLAEEYPAMGSTSPSSLGGSSVNLLLHVEDVDHAFTRVVAQGAKIISPVVDQFYGDRAGTVKDPFGHIWTLASRIEDLSANEVRQRAQEFFDQEKD